MNTTNMLILSKNNPKIDMASFFTLADKIKNMGYQIEDIDKETNNGEIETELFFKNVSKKSLTLGMQEGMMETGSGYSREEISVANVYVYSDDLDADALKKVYDTVINFIEE